MTRTLEIIRPDDWHLHLRDGEMMRGVLPHSRHFARAIVMPNLTPPVVTADQARACMHEPRAWPQCLAHGPRTDMRSPLV